MRGKKNHFIDVRNRYKRTIQITKGNKHNDLPQMQVAKRIIKLAYTTRTEPVIIVLVYHFMIFQLPNSKQSQGKYLFGSDQQDIPK